MEQNIGFLDRVSRLVVAIAILFVLIKTRRATWPSAIALITSGALLTSAASGYCPLYTQMGISTSDKI